MKSGETRFIVKKLDTKKPYNSVGFRLSNGKTTIKKSTDAQDTKDKVLVQDGVFLIPLQQTDTNALQGNVTLEAQINYQDHSVIMSDDNFLYINSSLGYDQVQGSEPAQDDGIEVVMTAIEEGVAVIVNPEASQELIDAVTDLFQDTKQIAQSVRDDADEGKFDGKDGKDGRDGVDGSDGRDGRDGRDGVDGKDGRDGADGFSPTVTVKTQTSTDYVLEITDKNGSYDTPNLQGRKGDKGDRGDGTVVDTAKGSTISLTDSADSPLDAISIMGKSTQTKTNGYQLIEKIIAGVTETNRGITFEYKSEGKIRISGTLTSTTNLDLWLTPNKPIGQGQYYAKGKGFTNDVTFTFVRSGMAEQTGDFSQALNLTTDTAYPVRIQIKAGVTNLDIEVQVMIERGTTSHDYESYTGGQPSPSINYPQLITDITSEEIQITNGTDTQTANLTKTLRGIPVSSGGNYTDNNNQQWLCDTIERYKDGSGKYIQRIGYIASYNEETITTDYISTTGGLNNGSSIIYILDTPIETPLTSEELAELDLDTYYPSTTISANADVVVEYVCDTKNWMYNHFEPKTT